MADKSASNIAFVLQDIDKADYVLADSNFKIISSFSLPAKQTIFNYDASNLSQLNYVGATTDGNKYNFIYKHTATKMFSNKDYYSYKIETVDFAAKNVIQKDFINVPKNEKVISGFSEYNNFFLLTAMDETSSLKIYGLSGNGATIEKTIVFPVQNTDGKKAKKLSDILAETVTINAADEPGLDDAVRSAKLFTSKDELTFLINDRGSAQVVTINTTNFSVSNKYIKHENAESKEADKAYTNAYITGNRLFLMQVVPQKITVSVFDLDGKNLSKLEINETNIQQLTNGGGKYQERRGSKEKDEMIDDFTKITKALIKGTQGIAVETTATGKYLITIGTYDDIQVSSGGGDAYHTSVQFGQGTSPSTQATSNSYYYTNAVPGVSKFVSRPNYYKTTSFSLLLDAVTLKPVKDKIPESAAKQIRNYVSETGNAMKNQFVFHNKQYYGYYDGDAEFYIFQHIAIRK
ncbi:MAG: hypothetical protein KF829_05060 [Ferruginibacter sp.]|nr:hypothetical protein [Ferruginibacter sp.]